MEKYSTISENPDELVKLGSESRCTCGAKKEVRGNCTFCVGDCGVIEAKSREDVPSRLRR